MNTKELYHQLFVSVLLRENISEVVCNNTKEHYFDRVVVNSDGSISVYSNGLKEPFKGLYFDFDLDYAKLLSYIEEDLYAIRHGGISKHDMVYKFQPETELRIRVRNLLSSHQLYYSISVINSSSVSISVDDGDWKHEHLALQRLMKENGFTLVCRENIRENGSDCYSAVHTYMYIGEE
jgi:hypothetical protein